MSSELAEQLQASLDIGARKQRKPQAKAEPPASELPNRLTASRFGLAELCTGFLALEYNDPPNKAAQAGTDKHATIERYLNGEKVECNATWYLRWREWWEGARGSFPGYRTEIAYSVNPSTLEATQLGFSLERDYSQAPESWWCGTADIVSHNVVADWKTGNFYPYYPPQLEFLAYCQAKTVGADRISVADIFVTDNGVAPVKWTELNSSKLESIGRRIQAVHGKPITQNPGAHCETYFCPARANCQQYQQRKHGKTTENNMTYIKGIIKKGRKIVIHGLPGVGKTGFAASAPGVVFLDGENGTDQLDVGRFAIKTWADVENALKEIETNPELKDTKAIAVDTITWLAQLYLDHIMRSEGKTAERFYAFGANKKVEPKYWRELLDRLDAFRERGINIIILCHSEVKNFKNPSGSDFDRYQLQLPEVAANLLTQWADFLLFINWETFTNEDEKGRHKGVFGERRIFTERTAAYDAKHRGLMADDIPFPEGKGWAAFFQAVKAGQPQLVQPAKEAS